jgi:uncharacterized protein (DUF924 family)
MTSENVLYFWFHELTEKEWFMADAQLDERIIQTFSGALSQAERGELFSWRTTPKGRLAEIILLDQFSRNIYRKSPKAFANDQMALTLSQELIHLKLDKELSINERIFAYMPHMHSESKLIHAEAVKLFSEPGMENNLKFERLHKDIIDRFERYPHRNEVLGRVSTPEEIEFLKTHSGF